jgi:hypothetical protein
MVKGKFIYKWMITKRTPMTMEPPHFSGIHPRLLGENAGIHPHHQRYDEMI